jgi:hypothetical protein
MAPTSGPPSFGAYWGIINSAAAERLTTAQLWDQIRGFEQEQGISRPQGLFRAVSAMRSLATSQRVARDALTSLPAEAAILAQHISPEINARPPGEQALAPAYNIRFKASVLTGEGIQDRWLTIINTGLLPATKGELTSLIASSAIDMSTGYGQLLVGLTGDMMITAV